MSKKVLIIVGVALLVFVVGAWLYLFFTGKTAQTGDFASFGAGQNANTPLIVPGENADSLGGNGGEIVFKRLQQLTLRPVAGAVIAGDVIKYVEAGTGHIYEINLLNGRESLLGGVTLPQTHRAVFSLSGTFVAITQYLTNTPRTLVGSVSPDGGFESISLPEGAAEVLFSHTKDGVFYYLMKQPWGSVGYSYDIESSTAQKLFEIPLRDVRVVWEDEIYVYTTPTYTQAGYAYRVGGNNLEYLSADERGLLLTPATGGPLITKVVGDILLSSRIHEGGTETYSTLIPEKCTKIPLGLVCGVPKEYEVVDFPDRWYKGLVSYIDILWSVDFETKSSATLIDLVAESGREIDIAQIGADEAGERFWFINKNDNSLWLFDSTI